mgnify:CR=1 FL=1
MAKQAYLQAAKFLVTGCLATSMDYSGKSKGLLTKTLYKLKGRDGDRPFNDMGDQDPVAEDIEADAVLGYEEDRAVLAIDQRLDDMPARAVLNARRRRMIVIQQNGGNVFTRLQISDDDIEKLHRVKRITIVTKVGDEKIRHYLPLQIRLN